MPPKNKTFAPPSTSRRGTHKSRRKPQPPPEFQPLELTSTDESSSLIEVKQTLGVLTTALAMMATQVEQLSQGKVSQVTNISAQPATRAGGIATAGTSTDLLMENHIWNMVEHWVSTAHAPALAITDDEMDGEEEVRSHASRGTTRTSGKLRSANTSAVHTVIWPHEYVYTPEWQPSKYESMSSMAFVTGYITIMGL